MKTTKLQAAINEAERNGYKVFRKVDGKDSMRTGSLLNNAYRAAMREGYTVIMHVIGAKRQRETEGYHMAVMVKK